MNTEKAQHKGKSALRKWNSTHIEIASAHRLAKPMMNITPIPNDAPEEPDTIPKIVMMLQTEETSEQAQNGGSRKPRPKHSVPFTYPSVPP